MRKRNTETHRKTDENRKKQRKKHGDTERESEKEI